MIKNRLLLFIIGLFSETQIKLIGYISISELFFLYYTFKVLWNGRKFIFNSDIRPFIIMGMLWMLSSLVTNIVRDNNIFNILKGISMPLFYISSFISLYYLLYRNLNNFKWFILGDAISGIISIYYFRASLFEYAASVGEELSGANIYTSYYWPFLFAITLFYYPQKKYFVLISIFIFGTIFFIIGARSSGSICYLSAFIVLLYNINYKFSYKFIAIGIIAITQLISFSYGHFASIGALGDEAQKKYEIQSSSDIGILSGRQEFVAAFLAITDSPIIGHGTAALDVEGYAIRGAELINAYYIPSYDEISQSVIASHSHLFGAWMLDGVLGFIFWFYLMFYIVRFGINNILYTGKYLPFVTLIILFTVWNFVFSPIQIRLPSSAFYIFIIILNSNINNFNKIRI